MARVYAIIIFNKYINIKEENITNMELTLAKAMKTIKQLESKKNYLNLQESKNFTYSYASDETPVIPEYNFQDQNKALESLDKKILELRVKINKANNEAKIGVGDLTIAEALIYMCQLNNDLTRLGSLTHYQNFTREVTRSGVIQYTKTMEDVSNVRKLYESKQKELQAIQIALDMANNTYTIEADLD